MICAYYIAMDCLHDLMDRYEISLNGTIFSWRMLNYCSHTSFAPTSWMKNS